MIGSDGRNYINPPAPPPAPRTPNMLQYIASNHPYSVDAPGSPATIPGSTDTWRHPEAAEPGFWQRLMALLGMGDGGGQSPPPYMMPLFNSPYGSLVSPASKAAAQMGQQFFGPYYNLDGTRNVPLTPQEQQQARMAAVDAYRPRLTADPGGMVQPRPTNPLVPPGQ